VELEYDLATAHRRTRELEDELQQQRSAREAAEAQPEAMEQWRIWRYSALPRRLYDRVRAMRNLE
jgi:multidrug resistance efflux pump